MSAAAQTTWIEAEERRAEIEAKIASAEKWLLAREERRPIDQRDEYDFRRTWRSEVPYACLVIAKELFIAGQVPDTFVKHFWKLFAESCRVQRFSEQWRKARDPSMEEWEHMQRLFGEARAPYDVRLQVKTF